MECKIIQSEKSDIIEREINIFLNINIVLNRGWKMLEHLQTILLRSSESHDIYHDQLVYMQVLLKK